MPHFLWLRALKKDAFTAFFASPKINHLEKFKNIKCQHLVKRGLTQSSLSEGSILHPQLAIILNPILGAFTISVKYVSMNSKYTAYLFKACCIHYIILKCASILFFSWNKKNRKSFKYANEILQPVLIAWTLGLATDFIFTSVNKYQSCFQPSHWPV